MYERGVMMILIIAEKPELGRSVAEAIFNNVTEKGGVIQEGNTTITWAFGHLLQLVEPEEYDAKYADRNNLDLLPIYFNKWKKVPAKDIVEKGKVKFSNKYKRDRLALIGKLLKDADEVIHCGDPDEEGQNLIDEILEYFNYQGNVLRLLVNDNLAVNIQKAYNALENNHKYEPLGNSAYARQMADKCFGLNESRLASIKLNRFLVCGRVQLPTLGLVVTRDAAIAAHEKKMYYALNAIVVEKQHGTSVRMKFKPNKDILDDDKYIYDKSVLVRIQDNLKGYDINVLNVTETEKVENAPLPYNATILQAEMNGRYGYALDETLKITQVLRDKYKAITYNRSDSQYLKEEHYKEAPNTLQYVLKNVNKDYPVDTSIKSKTFNDENVTAHHGIIPQAVNVDISKLTEKERNVYMAICERYIMQFLPGAISKVSKAAIDIPEGKLEYSCSKEVTPGWKEYFKKLDVKKNINDEKKNSYLESGTYPVELISSDIEENETKPLKKYTPKTLIEDMCAISKYVTDPQIKDVLKLKDKDKPGEKGSIGTVATRAAIIEALLNRGYLTMEGKNIISTELGKEFYNVIPGSIKSADVTAKWWLVQEEVKEGRATENAVMDAVVDEFNNHKATAYNTVINVSTQEKVFYGNCPVCGKQIYKGNGSYYCEGYKDGCDFKIYENTKHFNDVIKMTDNRVKALLAGKSIKVKLSRKDGNTYDANVIMKVNNVNGKNYFNLEVVYNK